MLKRISALCLCAVFLLLSACSVRKKAENTQPSSETTAPQTVSEATSETVSETEPDIDPNRSLESTPPYNVGPIKTKDAFKGSDFEKDSANKPYNKFGHEAQNHYYQDPETAAGKVVRQGQYTYFSTLGRIYRVKDSSDKCELVFEKKISDDISDATYEIQYLSVIKNHLYYYDFNGDYCYIDLALPIEKRKEEKFLHKAGNCFPTQDAIYFTEAFFHPYVCRLKKLDLKTGKISLLKASFDATEFSGYGNYIYCVEDGNYDPDKIYSINLKTDKVSEVCTAENVEFFHNGYAYTHFYKHPDDTQFYLRKFPVNNPKEEKVYSHIIPEDTIASSQMFVKDNNTLIYVQTYKKKLEYGKIIINDLRMNKFYELYNNFSFEVGSISELAGDYIYSHNEPDEYMRYNIESKKPPQKLVKNSDGTASWVNV